MSEQFLHGVEVVEIDDGIRAIRTVKSSVIGLVGTAPNADPEIKAAGTVAGLSFVSKLNGLLGNQTSIQLVDPAANSAALAVTVTGRTITVSLATSVSGAITSTAAQIKTAIEADAAANALVTITGTGSTAVAATFRPVFLTGGQDEPFPLNVPVLVAGNPRKAALLGAGGTLPDAIDGIFSQTGAAVVVVRVAEGEDAAETLANVVGAAGAEYTGVWSLLTAESVVGFCPRILIAPGFTSGSAGAGQKNAVVAELEIIANRLRAVAIADGRSTTDADAINDRRNYGNKRVYFHDVDYLIVKNGEVVQVPASAYIAGVIARTDNELGFWHSPSNKDVFGIVGLARPIDFTIGDANSQANLLNENEVATTIRSGGFKLWGNRTTSIDSKWAFLSVVRTADIINDSILRAHMWAVDRNITKTYYADVVGSVNAYIARLKNIGAIAGGRCWVDKTLNTAADIAAGRATIDFDFGAFTPAERLTFRSKLNQNYLEEIV